MIEKTFPITEKLLDSGVHSARKLLDLLNSESENLKLKTDPNTLLTIAGDKRNVVSQLETFTKQLGQVLATEKLSANHEGVHAYLNRAEAVGIDIGDCKSHWANITVLSKKCRALNEQNGASIELLSRNNQRALQILRGKSQLTSTYGPDGSPRGELFSHTLVSV